MENREVISSGKMISRFIGNFIGWIIITEVIVSILYSIIFLQNDSFSVTSVCIFYAITNIISIFLAAHFSSSMKKKTISQIDVASVMLVVIIFFVVVLLFQSLYNYHNVHSTYNKEIESNPTLSYYNSLISNYGTTSQKSEYQKQLDAAVADANKKLDIIIITYAISSLIMYGLMIPYVKKRLLDQSVS